MSGKNLTFKLVMDADNKGLVSTAKNSESVMRAVFETIKTESEKVKKASSEASSEVGNLVPSEAKQKVAQLVTELTSASKALEAMGSDADLSADNLKQMGDYGEQALQGLQNDLKQAKLHLNYLSATNATPADIQNAQQKVKELEVGVKQVKTAFDAYKGSAESAASSTVGVDHAVDGLGKESQETATQINKLDQELVKANKELQQTESFSQRASSEIQGLKTGFNAIISALAALGIGATAQKIAQTADEFKVLEARIGLATAKSGNFKEAFEGVKKIAVETRSDLTATAELFTRVKSAVDQLGYSQERALGITDLVNKSLIVGGGLAASNEAAVYQFNQALQSGVLRGEEFNSVMEQAPRLASALADGLGVSIGKLREMAGQGKLTSDVIVKALESQSEALNKEFAKMPVTIGQSITNLKTAWTLYIGEADAATGASAKVADAIKYVADNLDQIVSTLTLAAQAFIAYKALNIANVFLDKAAGVRAASVAITQETTAVVANTQAQLANATATRAAAVTKTQLATSSAAAATSVAASSGSIMTLVGRLGALGVAVTAVGVLIPTVFQPVGTWIGEAAAKTEDYIFNNGELAKSLEKLDQQMLLDAARAKVVAESKAKIAEEAEKARDKTYQLTGESKKLVAEFEELIKKGEPTKEALEKISNAMKFDSTKGINDSITALILLKDQGKITGDELQQSLGRALDGKDLVVFGANARAAFAGTSKEAEKTAQLTEAVMKAALERTGLSTEQLQGKFSLAFQSASNDVQVVLNNLDLYKQKGIDTGLALATNLNKAIDTSQTRAELDYAKSSLISLGKQGEITGEQVALGLSKIEQKAKQLPEALNPALAAFNALGIQTKDQLNDTAIAAQKNFEVVSKSGQATADGIKQAYTTMLNAAIATGDKAQIALAQAKAASLGLQVQIDETGKAAVKSNDEWSKSNDRVRSSAEGIADGYRNVGDVAREEAQSAGDAWHKAVQAANEEFMARGRSQGGDFSSYSKSQILSELKSMGYDDKQAEKLAGSIMSDALSKDKDVIQKNRAKGGASAIAQNAAFEKLLSQGLTSSFGTQVVQERLRQLASGSGLTTTSSNVNSYAPNINASATSATSTVTSKTVEYKFSLNGQTVSLYGSEGDGDAMESILSQLETLKKSS